MITCSGSVDGFGCRYVHVRRVPFELGFSYEAAKQSLFIFLVSIFICTLSYTVLVDQYGSSLAKVEES